MNREIVLDLANYQAGLTVAQYKKIGAKYAIIKVTENTNYVNECAKQLVNVSATGGVKGFAFYHFGRFTTDSKAISEAKYFINNTEKLFNIKLGTLLILDAEIQGMPTSAVIAFLKEIKKAGYKAGFYTYKYLLPGFNLKAIKPYMDFFWLAAYPLANGRAADKNPDFNYFPSADYVDLWQYTDNLLGYKVDGSISVTDNAIKLFNPGGVKKNTAKKSEWAKKNGEFTLGEDLHLHESPNIDSKNIALLKKGSVIKFDATLQGPKRLWLRQPRTGGKYGYIVAKDKNGKMLGKIK
ncbi:MAG: GH25 family lysozyme [Lactobacillus sp.]